MSAAPDKVLIHDAARPGLGDAVIERLCAALDDSAPEVVIQALCALGKMGRSQDLLQRLRRFYLHPNWQFRHGVVNALIEFLQRGVLQPQQLEHDLDQVLASTPYFKPEFTLNERLRELSDLVRPDPTNAQGGAVERLAASQR